MTPTAESQLEQDVKSLTHITITEIQTVEYYEVGCDIGRKIRLKLDEVDKAYDELITEAHRHHKNLLATKKKYREPLERAFGQIERMLTEFRQKQETLRLEQERQLALIAQQNQQQSLLDEAVLLEKQGDTVMAETVLAEAENLPAPVVVVASSIPKGNGVHGRVNWKFRIKDMSKIPDEYKVVNEQAIGQVVRAMKKNAERLIPGIEVYSESTTVIRR